VETPSHELPKVALHHRTDSSKPLFFHFFELTGMRRLARRRLILPTRVQPATRRV